MCLIGLRIDDGGALLLAANRDEFAHRPTQGLHWWPQDAQDSILAGRDLKAGGTWLGVTRSGRFAAVTNVRDVSLRDAPIPLASRGLLVTEYLKADSDAETFIRALDARMSGPASFNLLLGSLAADAAKLYWYGGRTRQFAPLTIGVHVLSNAELNTPWPKAQALRQALDGQDIDAAHRVLTSTTQADDHLLPDTGVGYAWEKKLSAPLITGPDYHTRSSTFMTARAGQIDVHEITWQPDGQPENEARESFLIAA